VGQQSSDLEVCHEERAFVVCGTVSCWWQASARYASGGRNCSAVVSGCCDTICAKRRLLLSFTPSYFLQEQTPTKHYRGTRRATCTGTTPQGGTFGKGTVFKLDKNRKYTVIYNFTGGTDGSVPITYLTLDKAGNPYGTTEWFRTRRLGKKVKSLSPGSNCLK
jgi:hypothetical protein